MVFILVVGFGFISCSFPDLKSFDDGHFNNSQEFYKYKDRLNVLLTNPDTMFNCEDIIVPDGFELDKFVFWDTLPAGNPRTTILLSNGKTMSFVDLNNPEETNVLIGWNISGYDSQNHVMYLTEEREYGFSRFFGVNLYTGNMFTVYESNAGGENEWMYGWSFSPDMKYLLKTGDLDNGEYGWSLVNLSNGIEFKKLYKQYFEFVEDPEWIKNDQFKIFYTKIPFKEGYEYTQDYAFYNSIKEGRKFQDIILTHDYFMSKEQVFDLKANLISEQFFKTRTFE